MHADGTIEVKDLKVSYVGGAPVRTTVRVLALLMVMFAMTAEVAGGAEQRVHEVKYRRSPARLTYDYRNNPPQYSKWQTYLRERQPPRLVVCGKNDPFFTVAGA